MPILDEYELKEENLLSYDQFEEIFVKPQCSMLFDTGAGYFAYCSLAPQFQEKIIGPSIKAENAVAEVKKYLINNEKQNV